MPRHAIPSYSFSLVVVRKDDQFLLVQEAKRKQHWYLPAGGVEPGETFIQAARRETLEEAGVPVEIDGIIRIEHTPYQDMTRMRMIFTGHPVDDTPPKQHADEHSLQAGWFTMEEIEALPLRSPEVWHLFDYVRQGGLIHPCSILASEG